MSNTFHLLVSNQTTVGSYILWLHNKVIKQSKKVTAKLQIFTTTSKNIVKLGVTLCNNAVVLHFGNITGSRAQVHNSTTSGT